MSSQTQSPTTPDADVLSIEDARDHATNALVDYYRSRTGMSDEQCATMAQRTMQKFDDLIVAMPAQQQQQQ